MKILSWNVNGIRAVMRKGFLRWLKKEKPDILCLQETKIHENDIPDKFKNIEGYETYWHSGKKRGYSGVAVLTKIKSKKVIHGIGSSKFDDEGRVLVLEFPKFVLINVYFPHSGRTLNRVGYKLEFCDHFLKYCDKLKKRGKKLLISGDYNIAHKAIDLKNAKANEKNAGFLPEERAWMDKFVSKNYIDTFRHFYPNKEGAYTWWSFRFNARARNIGWRVDYHCVTKNLLKYVKKAIILTKVKGSDHCPVGVELKI